MSEDSDTVLRVQWWPREKFEVAVPVCDACNSVLIVFPVCIRGSYALCARCQRESAIEPGDTEYFESFLYNVGEEAGRPRENFGGRVGGT